MNKSSDLIPLLILEELQKLKNVDNIIFVANDIIYEESLLRLKKKGVEDIIIMRLKIAERSNEMLVKYKWGDISYPIGRAIGLKNHEL